MSRYTTFNCYVYWEWCELHKFNADSCALVVAYLCFVETVLYCLSNCTMRKKMCFQSEDCVKYKTVFILKKRMKGL